MAHSPVTISPRWPGVIAALLVLLLTLGTLLAVVFRSEWADGLGPADWAAIRFTMTQAIVSAAISTGLAIPVARALARRRFAGRQLLISLLGAPFLLPVIVAILGLLAVFGRNGMINTTLDWFALGHISIYGFHGVVLGHVFFNLPLAIRLILQGWVAIPAERFRLAASLDAPIWPLLEQPMLRSVLPSAFLVIFLICLTSFAVALILGGGPRATTVELAIYQALRFDFDLGRAALLACVQFGLCIIAAAFAWRLSRFSSMGTGLDRVVQRYDLRHPIGDYLIIGMTACFLLLPMALIVWRGAPALFALPTNIWLAALRSVIVASASAALCVVMAVSLAVWGGRFVWVMGVLPLTASGLVVGTGAFLIVFPFINPAKLALFITVLVNAVLALPFALRSIAPAVSQVQENYGKLGAMLGLRGWPWIRIVVLPRIAQPLGFATGLAAALSIGDLGVITLFASDSQETLPLAMYRLMGAFRMEAAAGAALILLILSFGMFWMCDYGGRSHADL